MWGTVSLIVRRLGPLRFIPTHVGNGAHPVNDLIKTPVHPHACGERSEWLITCEPTHGSSPRMWGTDLCLCGLLLLRRFIPTHVGNGRLCSAADTSIAVHPHACGERATATKIARQSRGSSPRMWGTGPVCHVPTGDPRFIPTHVGNGNSAT